MPLSNMSGARMHVQEQDANLLYGAVAVLETSLESIFYITIL